MNVQDLKSNLSAELHGGTLNKVRNIEMMFERASNTLLSKIDPIDTMRTAPLSTLIYDDFYNYALPSDYKKIIGLIPQNERNSFDSARRQYAEPFDLKKALAEKTLSIEGNEGSKILRANWRTRPGKPLNVNSSYNGNGTYIAVGTASGIETDTITFYSESGSVRFDVAASGDGISNIGMAAVDMTLEDEVADVLIPVYFPSISALTSVQARWGNDITTKFWTSVAQTTQADGSPFKVGWNILKFPWSTATETGTVAPATIDSFKITFVTTGAIANIRIGKITFSIGRNFDIKYYSKYLLKNSSGTWIGRTTSDDDTVVLDNDAIQIYHLECLIAAAQQLEGTDSGFDIGWAKKELSGDPSAVDISGRMGLYAKYRKEYPSQSKKAVNTYGALPRFASRFSRR